MGVPKFFLWLNERYPGMCKKALKSDMPRFDCLYLDMNSIIHQCSHPDDDNFTEQLSEKDIFSAIFLYIEGLFRMVKPSEIFYLAVDGVAPRAKLNQQRGRRFRSAAERVKRERKAYEQDILRAGQSQFDSNCITPGTEFMDRLHIALLDFIQRKTTNGNEWASVTVLYSGHDVPGEGEHKIQEFIRFRRSLNNYNPNTRHCLYGLDADLVMLGLASHEQHVSLLREEQRFYRSRSKTGAPVRPTLVAETRFDIVSIACLRQYIERDFSNLERRLPQGEYNLEKIIDDWILMTFFVGNDFIPHLPNMDIREDSLPALWDAYSRARPRMPGYLNDGGVLNVRSVLTLITEMQHVDKLKLANNDPRRRRISSNIKSKGLQICQTGSMHKYPLHKADYYHEKMGILVNPDELARQAAELLRAMQWVSFYYLYGVASWSWFYPQLYSPFISDLLFADLDAIERDGWLKFPDLGGPFLPCEQLMSVLPPQSANLVPKPMQHLMIGNKDGSESPLAHYYPFNFLQDRNGHKQPWLSVVLLPFIDERELTSALRKQIPYLSKDEARRNKIGKIWIYSPGLDVTQESHNLFHLDACKVNLGKLPGTLRPDFGQLKIDRRSAKEKQRDRLSNC